LLQAAPGSGQMQDQAVAGPAEQGAAKEDLSAQGGRLAIGGEACLNPSFFRSGRDGQV
jgi:hypothetical protein